jgi:hypothetical protein
LPVDLGENLFEGKNVKQAASGGAVKVVASTPLTARTDGLKVRWVKERNGRYLWK